MYIVQSFPKDTVNEVYFIQRFVNSVLFFLGGGGWACILFNTLIYNFPRILLSNEVKEPHLQATGLTPSDKLQRR